MLDDKILDVNDLILEPLPVLANVREIRNYHDYLRVNFRRVHASDLSDYADFPGDAYVYTHMQHAFVDKGTWRWQCVGCGSVQFVDKSRLYGLCVRCTWPGDQRWAKIVMPDEMEEIEAILLQMPGRRYNNFLRDWRINWTVEYLNKRLQKAQVKMEAGEDLRKLSIAPTRTVTTGEILRASYWNNNVAEPINDISGDNGPIEFRDAIVPAAFTTGERNAFTEEPTSLFIWNSTLERLEYYDGTTYQGLLRVGDEGITETRAEELIDEAITQHLEDATHGGE